MTQVSRRAFLGGALSLPAVAWAGDSAPADERAPPPGARSAQDGADDLRDWAAVRALWDLDPALHHLDSFILAPHPRPVREAITRHRDALDRAPRRYLLAQQTDREAEVAAAAARHLGTSAGLIALTDSTTMGLGLVYRGLRLRRGDEIVTTAHDHFATRDAVRLAASRTGARVRTIELYPPRAPERATTAGILAALRRAVGPRTRVLALTWVHSSSGVRLPLEEIGELVARINRGRRRRVLLVVDAVHALGTQPIAVERLGCDAFVAGCHKWLWGPRGTGLVWARASLWRQVTPTIPSFTVQPGPGGANTPGGYHSFEHRWALAEAFALHERIGSERIAARIGELAGALRAGLRAAPGVTLHSPVEERLRSGVVCCSVGGHSAGDAVRRLAGAGVLASVTPYTVELARFGTAPFTTPQEVDAAVRATAALAR